MPSTLPTRPQASFWWICLALSILISPSSSGNVSSVAIEWDPDPGTNIAGYRVHYGPQSGNYTETLDVGLVTETTLTQLDPGRLYYCSVTSYTHSGLESDYCPELPVFVHDDYGVFAHPEAELLLLFLQRIGVDVNLDGPYVEPTAWFDGRVVMAPEILSDASFTFWCRMRPGPDSTPIEVRIDGASVGTLSPPSGVDEDGWVWIQLQSNGQAAIIDLKAGVHLLEIFAPDSTTELEQIALSKDPSFQPTDDPPTLPGHVEFIEQPATSTVTSEGQALTLKAEALASGPVQYQWFYDGELLEGETENTLQLSSARQSDSGHYTLLASSGGAAATTQPSFVGVNGLDFRVEKLARSTPGDLRFEVMGGFGREIQVWATCDLKDWELVGSAVNQDGTIRIQDAKAPDCPQRFYRLEETP